MIRFLKNAVILLFNVLMPHSRPVRVPIGPLRGMLWFYHSSVPSFYFGTFEFV